MCTIKEVAARGPRDDWLTRGDSDSVTDLSAMRVRPRPADRPAAPPAPGSRPAATAVAWSESSGPGSRTRELRLVLAAGPSVPHLRTD